MHMGIGDRVGSRWTSLACAPVVLLLRSAGREHGVAGVALIFLLEDPTAWVTDRPSSILLGFL